MWVNVIYTEASRTDVQFKKHLTVFIVTQDLIIQIYKTVDMYYFLLFKEKKGSN